MKVVVLLCMVMVAAVVAAGEERWAVLVAGSKGMWNYRH